jgi:hypothetical protein
MPLEDSRQYANIITHTRQSPLTRGRDCIEVYTRQSQPSAVSFGHMFCYTLCLVIASCKHYRMLSLCNPRYARYENVQHSACVLL